MSPHLLWTAEKVRRLRPETSLYLDLVRLAAVLLVLISHARRDAFTHGFLTPLGLFGQEGVATFFLLSGLLVAQAAARTRSLVDYLIARLSRLWSVSLAAILLTIVLDVVGAWLDPQLYQSQLIRPWTFTWQGLWQALSPALFLNSVPHFAANVGSNRPFWSLSYEACYYAGFGIMVFVGGWVRILLIALWTLFVGVPILLLAPLWLGGVAVQRMLGLGRARPLHWLLWAASLIGLALLFALKYRLIGLLSPVLSPSAATTLIEKYATVFLVGLNVVSFDRIGHHFMALRLWLTRPLRFAVDRSYSLYLYQAPLLFFFAACTEGMANVQRIVILYGGVIAATALLAEITERKRSAFAGLLARASARLHASGKLFALH